MSKYTDPDWANAVLLTIDVQRDFTLAGAPAEIPSTMEVVPMIRRLIEAFRRRNRPIVHVVRIYRPDGSNVDACRREGVERGERVVLAGSEGAELVHEFCSFAPGKTRCRTAARRGATGDRGQGVDHVQAPMGGFLSNIIYVLLSA